jgi:two-component system response regulator HupR/HoxA
MVALSDKDTPLGSKLLSERILRPKAIGLGNGHAGLSLKDQVEALERAAIDMVLQQQGGNISRAADELGLSRVGLRNKILRYDLRRDLQDDE